MRLLILVTFCLGTLLAACKSAGMETQMGDRSRAHNMSADALVWYARALDSYELTPEEFTARVQTIADRDGSLMVHCGTIAKARDMADKAKRQADEEGDQDRWRHELGALSILTKLFEQNCKPPPDES